MLALRGIGMICIFSAAILTGRELELRLKRRWIVLSEIAGGLTLLEKAMPVSYTHLVPIPFGIRCI